MRTFRFISYWYEMIRKPSQLARNVCVPDASERTSIFLFLLLLLDVEFPTIKVAAQQCISILVLSSEWFLLFILLSLPFVISEKTYSSYSCWVYYYQFLASSNWRPFQLRFFVQRSIIHSFTLRLHCRRREGSKAVTTISPSTWVPTLVIAGQVYSIALPQSTSRQVSGSVQSCNRTFTSYRNAEPELFDLRRSIGSTHFPVREFHAFISQSSVSATRREIAAWRTRRSTLCVPALLRRLFRFVRSNRTVKRNQIALTGRQVAIAKSCKRSII